MKIPRFLFVTGRLCFLAFVLLTSSYCLLTYIPFTYHQVNLGGLFPWVTTLVKFHPYLYWAALALVALTLAADLEARKTRALTLGFLLLHSAAGIVLLFHPLLAGLGNDRKSLLWSMAWLAPLLWVAAIDWLGHAADLAWGDSNSQEDRRAFVAAWRSSAYLTLLYAAISYFRYIHSANIGVGGGGRLLVLLWSGVYHLVIFMAVFVTVNLLRSVASLFPRPSRVEFLSFTLAAVFLLTLIIRSLLLAPISFNGSLANLFALATAVCLVAFNAGLGARLYRPAEGPVESGLTLLLMPMTFGRLSPRAARLSALLLIPALAYFLATKTAVMDWNYLLQKLSVLLVWTATFACFYAMVPRPRNTPARTLVLLLSAATSLGAYEAFKASELRWKVLLNGGQPNVAGVLDGYAGYDVSFKLIHDLLSPVRSGGAFYRFLSDNTNIPQSTRVAPVEVNLAENLAQTQGPRPNIFLFVIDSLRRDYLSCYNPSVTFTPSIETFARDSTVMQNAFTRYGGTGLSEPSIWVGGLLLHKQYITPFYPMNALQKLIQTEQYQSYVTKDPILSVIMAPSPSDIELDKGIAGMSYDFCGTLKELTEKLGQRSEPARPIFAYTQPQNIHISVINREGRTVPKGESYPGFDAPYASRLRRMDGCFGKFLSFLKASGLYDRSIIVLTSDHGDSLGEDGRWGHAYTLFPEIVRIPLIIHLPPNQKSSLSSEPHALSFLTDITPTLYYLLGHRPILRDEVLGRPLFTTSATEQTPYLRDWYMIASSYGPVYGILKNGGHSLFVVDAVNYQDYLFTLAENSAGRSEPVTPSIRTDGERLIRDEIFAVDRFYKFGGPR
jgi:hypothetical protein